MIRFVEPSEKNTEEQASKIQTLSRIHGIHFSRYFCKAERFWQKLILGTARWDIRFSPRGTPQWQKAKVS